MSPAEVTGAPRPRTPAGSHAPDSRPPAVPLLGRMVFVTGLLANLYALAMLIGTWNLYRAPWAGLALLVVAAAMPTVLASVAWRGDAGLPPWLGVGVVGAVFAVSIAVPLLLPPAARVDAGWNWGSGGMTLLALAAYRPIRWSVLLGLAHAVLAIAVVRASGLGWWPAEVAALSAALPPIAAAAYLRFYADALREHVADERALLAAEAARSELEVVRMAGNRRLAVLREQSVALLSSVIEQQGRVSPDDARTAKGLAAALRAALLDHRRTLWLPDDVAGTRVRVIASDDAAQRVTHADRSWLAATLRLLAQHAGWQDVRVVLDAAGASPACASDPAPVELLVAATGPATRTAADDPRLLALCRARAVRMDVEGPLLLIDSSQRRGSS